MLIKVWDSAGAGELDEDVSKKGAVTAIAPFSFHCAFDEEGCEEGPERESIEVRFWRPIVHLLCN
jgi:hypothetical protein